MARPTRLTSHLRSGREVLGVLSGRYEPALIEEAAHAGFDFYVVDVEHTSVSDNKLAECVRAGDAAGIPILARLGAEDLLRVGHFLDAGGDGVILAHITAEDELARLVELCCYPPAGARGAGTTRVARYGFEPTTPAWLAEQNDGLFLGALIEDALPADTVERIVGHPRVSAVFIGSRDLAVNLGVAGQITHPTVQATIDRIREACDRHGRPLAGMVRDLSSPPAGQLRMVGIGTMMAAAARTLRRPEMR